MKKYLKPIALFLLVVVLFIPDIAFAQCNATSTKGCANFGEWVSAVISWLTVVGGSLSLLIVIFAGYKYMTSQGEPKALEDAKNLIVGVVVGVMLLFTAGAIVDFLQTDTSVDPNRVPATSTTSPAAGTTPGTTTNPPVINPDWTPGTNPGTITNPPVINPDWTPGTNPGTITNPPIPNLSFPVGDSESGDVTPDLPKLK